MLHYASSNPDNGFAIDEIELGRIDAALVTSPQKGFKKPVIKRISSFLANFDFGPGTISKFRDLLGQQLVPQFPPKSLRKQLSDFAAAASVFPFNSDDF